jgi:hypothetical protein
MVGAITILTHVVVILPSSDWVTITPSYYFWVSTTASSNTIGEAMLI